MTIVKWGEVFFVYFVYICILVRWGIASTLPLFKYISRPRA